MFNLISVGLAPRCSTHLCADCNPGKNVTCGLYFDIYDKYSKDGIKCSRIGRLVAALTGSNDVHTIVAVWSRLIACVVQHWLLVATTWSDPRMSWHKACQAIRDFTTRIIASLKKPDYFIEVMTDLRQTILKTCRRNKRKKIGTVELLNNPELLDFCLT